MKAIAIQRVARFFTALFLAIGLFVVFAIGGIWLISISEALLRGAASEAAPATLLVDAYGTPLVVTFSFPKQAYRTVDNTPVIPASENHWMSGAAFDRVDRPWNAAGWLARVDGFADDAAPPGYWYFFVDADDLGDGRWRGYYVGFDSATGQKLGYMGTSGFTQKRPPANEQFLSRPDRPFTVFDAQAKLTPYVLSQLGYVAQPPWVQFVLADRRFVKVDLAARSLEFVGGADDILSRQAVGVPDTSNPELLKRNAAVYDFTFALLRPDRITLFDPRDERATDYILPAELRNASFTFYPVSKESGLAIQSQVLPTAAWRHELTWFSAAGETTRHETLRLNEGAGAETPLQKAIGWTILSATPPAILPIGYALVSLESGREKLGELIRASWPIIAGSMLLGIAFAVLAHRWRRRQHLCVGLPWLAFVFLLGLPGYIGYRLHRRWPIREQAPPAPVLTGVEIFA